MMKNITTSACLLAIFLAGCVNPEEDIQSWMAQQEAGMTGSVKPLPEIVPAEMAVFTGFDHPDPFRHTTQDVLPRAGSNEYRPDLTRRREPLEAYALETLAFVGILQRASQTLALVRADASLYQVRAGNFMGQDFGMVTEISDTELTLKELVEDLNGEWGERVTTLKLQAQQDQEAAKK